ncbi:uncharacterized protein LOC142177638 [Nicotiana tabacum]|uniref:Uncharacterized protein LOC142177638 n=1 Tax=Nicotiana tabacum TaxID=4097 RepID=A0AC58U0K4_TOBAC
MQMMYECFKEFSRASGLKANVAKSSIYFGGVPHEVQLEILQAVGFSKGELPFKYLGIPLSTKRISMSQCQPLVDKILGRITSWTSRYLSYAGRLQLIKTNLCKKKDKLWVQWIHMYYGKRQTIWETNPKNASWIVQKIIKAKKYLEEMGYTMNEVSGWKSLSVKKLYNTMRGEFQKVTWRRLTCNNAGAPKWIFVLNLAIQRRLLTIDRLNNWGITDVLSCPMCNEEMR